MLNLPYGENWQAVKWQQPYDMPRPEHLQFVYRGVVYRKDVMPALWAKAQLEQSQ